MVLLCSVLYQTIIDYFCGILHLMDITSFSNEISEKAVNYLFNTKEVLIFRL